MIVRKTILGAVLVGCLFTSSAMAEPIHVCASGTVNFSPKGGCMAALVDRIGRAQKEILVQCYSFTSAPIAEALIAAKQRGVTVRVLSDPTNLTGRGSKTALLEAAGIEVKYDFGQPGLAHNKTMTFDGLAVATGSFNDSMGAELHNAENLLILEDAGLAAIYAGNWHEHEATSVPRAQVAPHSRHTHGLAPLAAGL
jgi:phosphatidylserine/phosphatidylglycerophosphate/cardiolipin synthase-like enzyme